MVRPNETPDQPTVIHHMHHIDWLSAIKGGFGLALGVSAAIIVVNLTMLAILPKNDLNPSMTVYLSDPVRVTTYVTSQPFGTCV
jgi:hypothetical protein